MDLGTSHIAVGQPHRAAGLELTPASPPLASLQIGTFTYREIDRDGLECQRFALDSKVDLETLTYRGAVGKQSANDRLACRRES
jgi:hypothetical protein